MQTQKEAAQPVNDLENFFANFFGTKEDSESRGKSAGKSFFAKNRKIRDRITNLFQKTPSKSAQAVRINLEQKSN